MINWTNKYIPWMALTFILSIFLAHFEIAYSSGNLTEKVDQTSESKNKVSLLKPIREFPTDLGHLFDPEEGSFEVPTERTAHSKLYKEPNGSLVQEFYPKSIYYQNDTAQWVPIDSQLIPTTQAPFVVKNKANRFYALFGDEGKFQFQELGKFLDIWPMNPFPSIGSVTENKITYHNVYPNTDIQFTSDNDGVKEGIILQTPTSPHTFTMGIDTQGFQLKEDKQSGILTLVDGKEDAIANFSDPIMMDATNKIIGQATIETKNNNGKTQLIISADQEALKNPIVQYPITIHLTLNGGRSDSIHSSEYPVTTSTITAQQLILAGVQSGLPHNNLSANLYQYVDHLLKQEIAINKDTNFDNTTSLMNNWNLANRINEGVLNITYPSSQMIQPSPVGVNNDPILAIYRTNDSNESHQTSKNVTKWDKSLNCIGSYLQFLSDGSITLMDGDGNHSIFKRNKNGTFSPSMGVYSQLTKNIQSNLFTATRIDGLKLSFNLIGTIASLTAPDGSILVYSYDKYDRLSEISHQSGKIVSFSYDAYGHLSKVTGIVDLAYQYDKNGNLSLISDHSKNIVMGIQYPDEIIQPQSEESGLSSTDESHSIPQPNQGNIIQGKNNWKWVTPSERVTSPFGPRDKEFHKGLDIGAIQRGVDGDPVWAMADGTVEYAGVATGYGNVIYLRHPNGIQTRYGHLSSIHVKTGQVVQQGQLIGTMGHSGAADGTHLHFEICQNDQPVNPELFFNLPGRVGKT